jgi:hypothetical protein
MKIETPSRHFHAISTALRHLESLASHLPRYDVEFVVITFMGGVKINRGKFLTGCGVCRYQGD